MNDNGENNEQTVSLDVRERYSDVTSLYDSLYIFKHDIACEINNISINCSSSQIRSPFSMLSSITNYYYRVQVA